MKKQIRRVIRNFFIQLLHLPIPIVDPKIGENTSYSTKYYDQKIIMVEVDICKEDWEKFEESVKRDIVLKMVEKIQDLPLQFEVEHGPAFHIPLGITRVSTKIIVAVKK